LSDFERCSVDPTGTREHRAVLFEQANRAVSYVPTKRNHFNVLAEGHIVKKDRGDRTPLELFIAGVGGWEGHLRRQFENSKSK
jgi:hypothetical protein